MKFSDFRYLALALIGLGCVYIPKGQAASNSDHSGYISDVSKEREALEGTESFFVVWDVEKPDDGPTLKDQIFTEKLTSEFKSRYANQFGRTQAEQNLEFFNPNEYIINERGVAITSSSVRRRERAYGEYMIRRLAEFHMDNKMKSNPSTREVYKLKEELSEAEVSISKGYKIKSKYRISSNSLEVDFENPFADTRIETDLSDASTFEKLGSELVISSGKKVTKSVRVSAYYRTGSGVMKIVGRKKLTNRLSTDLSVTPNRIVANTREVFGLWGASYGF